MRMGVGCSTYPLFLPLLTMENQGTNDTNKNTALSIFGLFALLAIAKHPEASDGLLSAMKKERDEEWLDAVISKSQEQSEED